MSSILLGRICRTCLKKSNNMHKLRKVLKDELRIEDMLQQTIPNFELGMDDIPLPVEICEECLENLQISYEFINKCITSNRDLRNILNQQEPEIESFMLDVGEEYEGKDILAETDELKEQLKTEVKDEEYEGTSISHKISARSESPLQEIEELKLEKEMLTNNMHIDESSSSEGDWPHNDDENDSESKSHFYSKTKRKYEKKTGVHSKARTSIKTCLHCQQVFTKKFLLTQHLTVHDPDNEFICDICHYRFSNERKLKLHYKVKHEGLEISLDLPAERNIYMERDFKCKVCSFELNTLNALAEHMNCEHPDILPFKCKLCEKAFALEHLLNKHINEHMGFKKHTCEVCKETFPNNTTLKDHMRLHTGESSPFLCPHCGKSFKTSNILSLHIRSHGEKKFQCPECPMKFYAKIKLSLHMSSHTKLKPYICDICGSAFTRQYSLNSHKFTHTGERPFKCDDCNMSFVFKRHLKRHRLVHTGEKPHRCKYCDSAYAASGDLVKHLRTHVGEKTYFCDQCSEAFKYAIELKEHKIMHYKEQRQQTN